MNRRLTLQGTRKSTMVLAQLFLLRHQCSLLRFREISVGDCNGYCIQYVMAANIESQLRAGSRATLYREEFFATVQLELSALCVLTVKSGQNRTINTLARRQCFVFAKMATAQTLPAR